MSMDAPTKTIKRKTAIYSEIPKILVVKREIAEATWNKALYVPLKENERVIVHLKDDEPKFAGKVCYITVKHGSPKKVSVFALHNFLDLKGRNVKYNPDLAN